MTNKATFPIISKVQLLQTSGGVTVVVTGFSPTDDVVSGLFTFALSTGATLTENDIPVTLEFSASSRSYATHRGPRRREVSSTFMVLFS